MEAGKMSDSLDELPGEAKQKPTKHCLLGSKSNKTKKLLEKRSDFTRPNFL